MEQLSNVPSPEELYKMARDSSMDLVKFVLTMATTILGVFFITLTGKTRRDLTCLDIEVLQIATWLMIFSVAFGLIGWGFHSMYYAAWAANRPKSRRWWRLGRKSCFCLFVVLFIVGIFFSGKYIILISSH